ncbi:ABC transporter ATP-binding protein [Brevibacillus daliensis]|uniref:ABC transporter ATP-binding protein n=1 Tax=Brevibacillus daliensis TaxID=2892995 RepID=UPI001E60C098|nr:betaine/proline/choline family ABC transporter ATP-binding protein [Brevibacillus daliensis]
MENAIRFSKVCKKFDQTDVILDLYLEIPKGKIVVLVGPSGCGKTTLLKMINLLHKPSSGNIFVNDKNTKEMDPVELRRGIGYVIQHVGIFPHMTIAENVALVPRLKNGKSSFDQTKVDQMLQMVGLDPKIYRNRYPAELSGGQQQRVGVARALMSDPPIILMDEPFSALDPITREQLQDELIRINQELNKTIVFVTHDMDEALKIADHIIIMQNGKIIQQGTPDQLLRRPVNDFVREFIGEKRLSSHLSHIVDDVMIQNPVTISPKKGLAEALKLMHRKRVTGLIIVDSEKKYLGLIDSNDIYNRYQDENLIMQNILQNNAVTILTGTPLSDAIPIIQETHYGYVPVISSDGKLAGLLTRASLIDTLTKPYLERKDSNE